MRSINFPFVGVVGAVNGTIYFDIARGRRSLFPLSGTTVLAIGKFISRTLGAGQLGRPVGGGAVTLSNYHGGNLVSGLATGVFCR